MTLGKHIRGLLLPPILLAVVFHNGIDVASIVVGVVVLCGAGLYGLAPTVIDPKTGHSWPDRAVIPELIRARRERRRPGE